MLKLTGKSKDTNEVQPENILDMLVTFEVLKLSGKVKDVKALHPKNI